MSDNTPTDKSSTDVTITTALKPIHRGFLPSNTEKATAGANKKRTGPKPGSERITRAAYDLRLLEVEAWLLSGKTKSAILSLTAEWKLSEAQIEKYINKAWAKIRECNERAREEMRSLLVGNLFENLDRAKRAGDRTEVRQTVMAIAKLVGLEESAQSASAISITYKKSE